MPDSLIGRLFHYAKANPAHEAVVTPTFTLSYAQLAELVQIQVKAFNNAGISRHSVIGINCPNDVQHLLLCLSTTYVGATSCTIPSFETVEIQNSVINYCHATTVVNADIALDPMTLDQVMLEGYAGSTPAITPAEKAHLLFSTSGTTGEPKLVVHHDSDLVAQAHRHIQNNQERFACLATMEHNFAKRHRLYCVAMGATNVFLDNQQASLVEQCQSLDVNVLHVSAFQAQELLARPDINTLRNIRLKLGGSHASLALRQQLRDNITQNLQAGYGTTETGAIAFTNPDDLKAGESVGQPLPGIEIRAVCAERKPLGIDERGELAIRCDGMFREYLGKPDLTAARLAGGWFYTGDIGYLDKQQRIYLCGRSDDMFIFNSMNIYPQDIETQICQHPDITDAVVLPKPSSVHGNIPVALVVYARGVKPNLPKLKKFMRGRAGVRSPRQFTVVDDIPRNTAGKISRRQAIVLTIKNDKVRHTIINALAPDLVKRLKPAMITAFEKGEKDIILRKINLDSLARMELLVALELEYGTVIMPQVYSEFRSLGDIASHILSSLSPNTSRQNTRPPINDTDSATTQTNRDPYVVRFFQRVFGVCHTVAQLNKALTSLENRLTPLEVECLLDFHLSGQLIPPRAAEKFGEAITNTLGNIKNLMADSGKQQPEPFVAHRKAPPVTLFTGPGSPAEKTLLICFSERGHRQLSMPNAVLMQHTDSTHYDLLIIAEPLGESYRLGVPHLGNNVIEVSEWLANQDFISDYNLIRTFGSSAGAYPAVVAGYRLKAEIAVSVGGRFHHRRKHPIKFLERVFFISRAASKGNCSRVLLSYSISKRRDKKYAQIIAALLGGNRIALEFVDKKVGHKILRELVRRGELASFLARTIFAEMNDELIVAERANVIMSFPAAKVRPL